MIYAMSSSEIIVLISILLSQYQLLTVLHLPLSLYIPLTGTVTGIIIHYLKLRSQGKALVLVLSRDLAIDVCGTIVPTILALVPVLVVPSPKPAQIICLVTLSISIAAITSLSTTSRMLVNVIRFVLIFTCLSAPFVDSLTMLTWIPLISILGIIVGADLIPYLLILKRNDVENRQGIFIIGGAGLLDAITLSYLMSRGITGLIYTVLSRL